MKTLLVVAAMTIGVATNAQDALWQLDFDKQIEWTKITDSGILLVGTSDRTLHGVDSRDGNKLWDNDILKAANKVKGPDGKNAETAYIFDTFVNVLEDEEAPEISDFVEIKFTDHAMYKNYAIINLRTGEEVISPRKADMPITKFFGKEMPAFNYKGTTYIPELRQVIISASWIDYMDKDDPDKNMTKMVSLPSGEIIWETSEIGIDGYPYVLNNGDIILPGKTKIARMNAKTGEVIWEYNTSNKKQTFESFDMDINLTTGYFFEKKKNNGTLSAVNLKSGQKLWEVDMKLKTVPTMSAMGYGVVVIDDKWFTLYDLKNGAEKWKAKKMLGTVVDLGDNGIAVESKGKFLVLLDKETGEIIWDQKIKGIDIDQVVAKGIMYRDIKGRLGLIDYDGNLVWDKKGMLEVPSVRYRPEFTKELMYIDGDLYEVDLLNGDYKVLKSKIDKAFQGDEEPDAIELIGGDYLVSSPQNFMMLGTDGSVKWQKYWGAPEMSLAAKIALRTLQVASVVMAASMSVESARHKSPYGGDTYYSKMYAQQAEDWAAIAGMAGQEAKKKFKATVSKGHHSLVLTSVGPGGQKKGSGLVKVDRRTGEEAGSLLLGDKEPVYDYDNISGQVFFKADKKQIISYSL